MFRFYLVMVYYFDISLTTVYISYYFLFNKNTSPHLSELKRHLNITLVSLCFVSSFVFWPQPHILWLSIMFDLILISFGNKLLFRTTYNIDIDIETYVDTLRPWFWHWLTSSSFTHSSYTFGMVTHYLIVISHSCGVCVDFEPYLHCGHINSHGNFIPQP